MSFYLTPYMYKLVLDAESEFCTLQHMSNQVNESMKARLAQPIKPYFIVF